MENLIKGILISFISLIVVLFLSILILPWMWNWIVFIYQSPYSAGVATNIYLAETIEAILPYIIGGLAGLVFIRYVIDEFRTSHEVNEYYIESKPHPTLQETLTNIPSDGQILASINGSRGEERFDFGKYNPGSNEAAIAYRNSQEYKDNQEKLRTLDDAIKEARKYVAG